MQLVKPAGRITVSLNKDLVRSIKCGQAWLFSNAVELVKARSGSVAQLLDRKGNTIASGIYDPEHPIVMRICRTREPLNLDDNWLVECLEQAIAWRQQLFDERTTGYRLVAGEGDLLPGLIIDRYDDTAVIKLDGGAPEEFYVPDAIGKWLAKRLSLKCVIHRPRGRGSEGQCIVGAMPSGPVEFLENSMRLTADVLRGQKTGFFLDQRDNRQLISSISAKLSVLNLFSYNGGFSVAAGLGGASAVISVDVAEAALSAAQSHWQLNQLPLANHRAIAQDCFDFLQAAKQSGQSWDLVICDPPSFAPNQQAVQTAQAAYTRLAQLAASVVRPGGLLALASCSSHINAEKFSEANLQGFSRAHRTARLLLERGLPGDHPTPAAMPELKYLKFQLLRLQ
jgi:23S rRNA (cytosine1962-C5)-methyltransferase